MRIRVLGMGLEENRLRCLSRAINCSIARGLCRVLWAIVCILTFTLSKIWSLGNYYCREIIIAEKIRAKIQNSCSMNQIQSKTGRGENEL